MGCQSGMVVWWIFPWQKGEPFQGICPLKIKPLQNLVEIAHDFVVVGFQSAFGVVPRDHKDASYPHRPCHLQVVKGISDKENSFFFQVMVPYPLVPQVDFSIGVMVFQTEDGFEKGSYAVLVEVGEKRLFFRGRQHTLRNPVALKNPKGLFGSGMELQRPALAFVSADKLIGQVFEAVLFQVETQFEVIIDDGEIEGFPVLPDRNSGEAPLVQNAVDYVDAQLDVV